MSTKSFTLIKKVKSTFSFVARNMNLATTFIFKNINNKINLTFVITFATKVSSTINIKKTKLTFIMKQIQKPAQSISSKKIRLVFLIKERLKAVSLFVMKHRINYSMNLLQKLVVPLKLYKIRMTIIPTLAQFFILSTYDPQTLSALDAKTLGEMDDVSLMGTFTITIASPAVVTLSTPYLGLATGDRVYATTTGSLPTGIVASTHYYIIYINTTTFNLATSYSNAIGGIKINTSGSQSGIHTMYLV